MKTFSLLLVTLTLSVLSGCSSMNTQEVVKQQLDIERLRADFNQQRQNIEQEQREKEINTLPTWVLTPLLSDQTGFYAVGTAMSKSIHFVMKKAKMQAEFELAKQYHQLLSGAERSFERENSSGELVTQTTVLIDKLIDEVPIVGYDIIKQKVIAINGKHTAYILLKMPYEQYNKVLQAKKEEQTEVKVADAFEALQSRLKSRREEKRQVKTQTHQQYMAKTHLENQLLIDKLKAQNQVKGGTIKGSFTQH